MSFETVYFYTFDTLYFFLFWSIWKLDHGDFNGLIVLSLKQKCMFVWKKQALLSNLTCIYMCISVSQMNLLLWHILHLHTTGLSLCSGHGYFKRARFDNSSTSLFFSNMKQDSIITFFCWTYFYVTLSKKCNNNVIFYIW